LPRANDFVIGQPEFADMCDRTADDGMPQRTHKRFHSESTMRKLIMLASVVLLPAMAGCALSDLVFAALQDNYSGGGYTQQDKQRHYEGQIEAWQNP